jgi:hypothetical protein
MDNETLASLLRGRNRAGQPVDATANIIGPAMSALGNTIYGAGRGALTAMAGLPGDINQLITDNLGTLVNAQGLPTTKEIQDFLPAKPTTYEGKLAQKLGEFVPVNPTPIAKSAVAIAKPVGKAMGEQAYRMTEDMLQKQGMMPSITTWHASPHKFEAFDASKVGTGEGAQSYGHGAGYVAENPKVAQEYYNAFTDIESAPLIFKGRKVDTPWNDDISQRWSDVIAEKKLSPSQIEDFQGILGNLSQVNNMQDVKSVVRDLSPTQLRMYKSLIEPELTKPEKLEAYMYKVDVADKAIPKMLDWDKPVAEQKNLMNLLKKDAKKDSWVKDFLEMDLKDDPTLKGKDLYDKLKYKFNENQVEASKYLESKGITGIKYLDAISRKEGGTSNFVPFNAKNMKILERNNEPLSRKDIIEEQINKLEPTITVQDRTIPVTLHPVEARQGNKIEYVNTDKFENAFKKDETGYIGKGGNENAIGKRYQGVEEFLKTAPSMRASEVHVRPNGSVVFGDGRHRYAFLRDQGLDKIPISMDADSIKYAKKFGYID